MFRRTPPVVFLLVALAACSGGGSHPAHTDVTTPGDALAALAEKGAAASYAATYDFHQAAPDSTATVKVWRAESSLRVDVVSGATTATLLMTTTGSYSCSITGTKRSCLLIAPAGQPVPKPFDVAPATLFTADLRALAADSAAYDVQSAPPSRVGDTGPTAQCFSVTPRATGMLTTVPTGRYCFIDAGLLAAASYPSGNTVRMTQFETSTPDPAEFTPYAKPTPLPS